MSIKRRLGKLELIGERIIQAKEKKEKAITYWLESIKHEGNTITDIRVLRQEPGSDRLEPLDMAGYLTDIAQNEETGREWVHIPQFIFEEMSKQGYSHSIESDLEKFIQDNPDIRETARVVWRNHKSLRIQAYR